jgi:plasmid stability protein
MPSVTVKNIPPELYERLKQAAAENHRSVNKEIIACIENAVRQTRPGRPEQILSLARKLREHTGRHPISDQEFTRRKRAGRP